MNAGLILAELLLSASIVTHSFPAETKEIKNTFENASSLFVKEIKIEKDDNLPSIDFSKIFGENPTDEEKNKPFEQKKEDMALKIISANDDFVGILKIGDKSILINAGKPENFQTKILPAIGELKISKLDAVIYLDTEESYENIVTIAEMRLTKRVLVPNIVPNPDENNSETIVKLKELEDKLREQNTEMKKMSTATSIQLGKINMTFKINSNSTSHSLLIENNENNIYIAGNINEEIQKDPDFVLPQAKTLILETKNTLTEELIKKTEADSIVLVKRSKEYEDSQKEIIDKYSDAKPNSFYEVDEKQGVNILLPDSSPDLEVKKVNAQSNVGQ